MLPTELKKLIIEYLMVSKDDVFYQNENVLIDIRTIGVIRIHDEQMQPVRDITDFINIMNISLTRQ